MSVIIGLGAAALLAFACTGLAYIVGKNNK